MFVTSFGALTLDLSEKLFSKRSKLYDLYFAPDGQVRIVSRLDKKVSVVTDLNIYYYIE